MRYAVGVKSVGRLVEKQQFWVVQYRLCDTQPLSHTQRIRLERVVYPISQPHKLDDWVYSLFAYISALQFGIIFEIVKAWKVIKKRRRLNYRADLRQRLFSRFGYVVAIDGNAAAIRKFAKIKELNQIS